MMADLYYEDDWLQVWAGDNRSAMSQMPEKSVHAVITSPPYYGLRSYGTGQWEGGDPECDHERVASGRGTNVPQSKNPNVSYPIAPHRGGNPNECVRCGARKVEPTVWGGDHRHNHEWGDDIVKKRGAGGERDYGSSDGAVGRGPAVALPSSNFCECGAWRGALGLEPTVELYVEHLVEVFREVRRVLRDDGVLWLNLGDSYANDSKWGGSTGGKHASALHGGTSVGRERRYTGLKGKDLIGVPWAVAFALRADGWFLRQDIVWAKPNAMPESVEDRPSRSHEFIFMLAKGQWKPRVVQLSNGHGERGSFHEGGFGESSTADSYDFAVGLATAVLDVAESEEYASLRLLDAEIGEQRAGTVSSETVGDLPVVHAASGLASRFFASEITSEQFLSEMNSLGVSLPDDDHLCIGRTRPVSIPLPPSIYRDSDTAIAIDYPGKVCKIDFAHDQIVTLTPTTCSYFYDHLAVKEPPSEATIKALKSRMDSPVEDREYQHDSETRMGKRSPNRVWSDPEAMKRLLAGRNMRDVWTIATVSYPGAHYATFPPKLVEPMVKSSTSEGGVCAECGAPFKRQTVELGVVTAKGGAPHDSSYGRRMADNMDDFSGEGETGAGFGIKAEETVGWEASCTHEGDPVPATVLDPFGGSGTVAMVAQQLSRRAILVDLNTEYIDQQMKRNAQIGLGL